MVFLLELRGVDVGINGVLRLSIGVVWSCSSCRIVETSFELRLGFDSKFWTEAITGYTWCHAHLKNRTVLVTWSRVTEMSDSDDDEVLTRHEGEDTHGGEYYSVLESDLFEACILRVLVCMCGNGVEQFWWELPFPHLTDICRVCRLGPSPNRPLFHPCMCIGSIGYVHQDWYAQLKPDVFIFIRLIVFILHVLEVNN